ncbi:MAG: FHA domain-containing protein [Silvibacterium sp.]|nr:FHA domain-containing protein [Silvibacterium sp.]
MDLHFHIQTPEGKTEAATFPAELSVHQLITEFVTDDKMRIQPPDPEQWTFLDQDSGEHLDPKKSLQQNGVQSGHMLRLARRKGSEQGRKGSEPISDTKPEQGGSHVLTRCENGHYFDPKKHTKCPYCGVGAIRFERSLKLGSAPEEHTRPAGVQIPASSKVGDDAVTRPLQLVQDDARIDPVVGWLIAISGPEKGKDYRIRSENNTIGRSKDMYICISGDESISRERHTVITFDPQRNAFYLSPGEGRGLVYLNGEALLAHKQLEPYDQIMLGKTKLVFVPFCGDKFKWE